MLILSPNVNEQVSFLHTNYLSYREVWNYTKIKNSVLLSDNM